MSRTKSFALISGLAIGVTSFAAVAENPNLDNERAYGAELMADASSRTSLLQAGGSGYNEDSGFFMSSADGNFSLNVHGYAAFAYSAALGARAGGAGSTPVGFQNVATQLSFSGNAINPDTNYKIQFDFSDSTVAGVTGGAAVLEDAWVTYNMENGVTVGAGQFFLPAFHEQYRVSDSGGQTGSRRSVVTDIFGGGYSQGVWAHSQDEEFEWFLSFNDGVASANSNFNGAVGAEADYGFTARLNWLNSGDWGDFKQQASFRGAENAFYVGAAFHFQQGGNTLGTANPDVTMFIVDSQYKSDGWQVFAQFVYNRLGSTGGTAAFAGSGQTDADQLGFTALGSYFFDDQHEIFAGYDFVNFDNGALGEDTLNFLTAGWNYYLIPESHAARFTIDAIVLLDRSNVADGVFGPALSQSTGLVPSNSQGQVAVRGQMQLAF